MSWKSASKLLVLAGLVVWAWWWNPWRGIDHPPGVLVPRPPVQADIPPFRLPEIEGWQFDAIAKYDLRGRVLGTKRYYSGANADIVPYDVAVSWGRMSDSAILDKLGISMSNRFFFYEWENSPPLSAEELKSSAANNHIIAANADVRKTIRNLRRGHIIQFQGYLVNAIKPGEGTWNSSRQRDDTGNGACEVFYVETANVWETAPPEFSMGSRLTSTSAAPGKVPPAAAAIR